MCTKSHGTVILIDKFLAQFGLRHAGVVLLITMTPPTLRPHTGSMQSVLYAMHSCMYIRIGVGNIWLVKIPSYTPPPPPPTQFAVSPEDGTLLYTYRQAIHTSTTLSLGL